MPLTVPTIDTSSYQDLFNQAVARIPVHTPEWTNFNKSDPGITIVGVLAFLTESILYRCNQIPDRNRLKFLSLLGVALTPASSAQGIVAFANANGPPAIFTLTPDLEVDAGQVPFRTEEGLDVLPIEAQVYFKQSYTPTDDTIQTYYSQLYASYTTPPQNTAITLYQLTMLGPGAASSVDLTSATTGLGPSNPVDGSVWIALLARQSDVADIESIRALIAGKTLTLGIVAGTSSSAAANVDLTPNPLGSTDLNSVLGFYMPAIDPSLTPPSYRRVTATPSGNVLSEPGTIEIVLPSVDQLDYWMSLDPLTAGAGEYPPALDDTTLAARVLTWIRVQVLSPTNVTIYWMGINVAEVTQLTHVVGEVLPNGTGAPDQIVSLAHPSVLPGSVSLVVSPSPGPAWQVIDDLMAAGPEVPVVDPSVPPGTMQPPKLPTNVYLLDPEAGALTFGDGTHGRRPAAGATMQVDYDYSAGADGNVEAGSINAGPALPSGVTVSNPVRTWGGSDAETPSDGEKQITRYLQHRDRLVTKSDFQAIARRTPGVSIGRVDVLPAFDPSLSPNAPGDAPGTVTLMVLPSSDPTNPNAPVPSQDFLNAIANWLDPRRLVTTEIILSGPSYLDVYLSIGISVVSGASVHDTIVAVQAAIQQFLSPLPPPGTAALPDTVPVVETTAPSLLQVDGGWPLSKAVVRLEVLAVASRVTNVLLVNDVLLSASTGESVDQIPIAGLQLPRLAGLSIVTGDPTDIDDVRGASATPASPTAPQVVPVPVIPEDC
ncbi:MAG TPA: baseplate J/gp47 family protein [Polyangiaceae bacterium]